MDEHPFYVSEKGFVPAKSLGIGTEVVTRAGPKTTLKADKNGKIASSFSTVRVTNVERRVGKASVKAYNFVVADYHTYFVGSRTCVTVASGGGNSKHSLSPSGSDEVRQWVWVHNGLIPCGLEAGEHTETYAPKPTKPQDATGNWDKFLGDGPYTNNHPRTGLPDPDRIVSADGTRSIRYGNHEMKNSPTKHHYHEETWKYNPVTNRVDVSNTVVRVPLPK
jgi:hypothetical protein